MYLIVVHTHVTVTRILIETKRKDDDDDKEDDEVKNQPKRIATTTLSNDSESAMLLPLSILMTYVLFLNTTACKRFGCSD
jgi:hypothetical protein